MNKTAIIPGSFDPVTNGHMDIIKRTCLLFDKVFVGVLYNINKKTMFSAKQRVEMLKAACADFKQAEAVASQKLLVDLMKELNAEVIVRGIRTNEDLIYEQQMNVINTNLYPQSETIVLLSKPELQIISSSAVRELLKYKQDVSSYVPKAALDIVYGGRA